MTRVLQVLGRSAGGIARHVADVVAALDGKDGVTMDIAGPPDLPVPMPKQVREVTIPDGPLGGHRSAIRALRALGSTYDVVHAHGLRAGIDAGIATRDRARSLVTVHNLVRPEIAGWKTFLYRRAEGLVVATNDRVFAVSEDIARRLRTAAPRHADDVEVLYLGLATAPVVHRDRNAVRSDLGVGPETKLVVTVARLAPQKALHVLLAAAQQMPDVIVAIVGEGPLRTELEVDARYRGIGDRVRFLGFLEDARDYIAAGDVFCLSSVWEGVPLAAQEAIRLHVPVVATDVGGMRELISNKLSGRLVPAGDPDALAKALRETLATPDDRDRFTQRALEDLERRFSSERMLARLSKAYAS